MLAVQFCIVKDQPSEFFFVMRKIHLENWTKLFLKFGLEGRRYGTLGPCASVLRHSPSCYLWLEKFSFLLKSLSKLSYGITRYFLIVKGIFGTKTTPQNDTLEPIRVFMIFNFGCLELSRNENNPPSPHQKNYFTKNSRAWKAP